MEHLGALKTAVVALATVDGEDTHPGETRTGLLANVGTENAFTDSLLTGELTSGLKGLGHHGLDVETFDEGAELGGKSGVHLTKSVWWTFIESQEPFPLHSFYIFLLPFILLHDIY